MAVRKIANNVFWLLAEHCVRILVAIGIASLLARQLGVEQYGLFQYALGVTVLFISISYICGAEVLVPQLVGADDYERNSLLSNAFVTRLAFSVLAYLLLLLFSFLTDDINQFLLTSIVGSVILLNESFAVVVAWLQSQTNSFPKSILMMFSGLLKIAVVYTLFFMGNTNPLLYASAWLAESVFVAGGLGYIYTKHSRNIVFLFSIHQSLALIKKGFPFFLGLIFMYVFLKIDILFLRHLETPFNLGLYVSSMQLFLSLMAVAPILAASLAPVMVYQQSDNKIIKNNILLISAVMLLVSAAMGFGIKLFSPWVIYVLFGNEFSLAAPILGNLAWVACLFFLNESLNLYLIKKGAGMQVAMKWFATLFVCVPMYYYLIKVYGVEGAVFGYGLGYLVSCIVGLAYLLKKKDDIHEL